MRKIILAVCFFVAGQTLFAQDYFTGKITDDKGGVSTVYYDRTQFLISAAVHQSRYKLLDSEKKSMYDIYITHDQQKGTITFSVSIEGTDLKGNTINYNKQKCGLIFCDAGNTDTIFPASKDYAYLLSFTDTTRDYPVLHKLKTSGYREIELDPLTRLRIKKHTELVKKLNTPVQISNSSRDQKIEQPKLVDNLARVDEIAKESSVTYPLLNDPFNLTLFALRDSLYSKNSEFIQTIANMRTALEYDLSTYMKDAHVYSDEERYEGEKKNGSPQGTGLLVSGGNIYDGTFVRGTFVRGKCVIKTKTTVYYGQCVKDSMSGTGWLKYGNGGFLLGVFRNNKLYTGICLSKENGEVFFGCFGNGQRKGYGELRNSHGDSYYGEFLNGRLVKGYSKEVDQFGYSTYSRIENGKKATVAAPVAEAFFDAIHTIKEKAETQPQ